MRRVLVIAAAVTVAVIGGYSLYWHAAAGTLARAIDNWAAAQRAEGYEIAYGAPEIVGFPFRLEARLAAPVIGSPGIDPATATGSAAPAWRWAGPSLTLRARPWSPLDAEALAPGRHDIEIDDAGEIRRFAIDSTTATGRARFAGDGRVNGAEAEITDLLIVEDGAEDRPLVAETASLRLTPGDDDADHTRPSLGFELALGGVLLPPDDATPLGRKVERLEIDGAVMGRVDTAQATPREALTQWRDDGGTLELGRVVAQWGPLYLTGDGTFALDGALQPIGAMSTTISGHEAALDALVEAGTVSPRDGSLAKIVLTVLSKPSPVDGTPELSAPLTLQDGWLWAGPAKLVRMPLIEWE